VILFMKVKMQLFYTLAFIIFSLAKIYDDEVWWHLWLHLYDNSLRRVLRRLGSVFLYPFLLLQPLCRNIINFFIDMRNFVHEEQRRREMERRWALALQSSNPSPNHESPESDNNLSPQVRGELLFDFPDPVWHEDLDKDASNPDVHLSNSPYPAEWWSKSLNLDEFWLESPYLDEWRIESPNPDEGRPLSPNPE
jgi:hypothetical protein